jgi:hypothetical protein
MPILFQLTAYVLAAMTAWAPRADPKHLHDIALDIAAVSLEQAPLFKDDDHRARTALLFASIARYESDYAEWVDDGRCNDRAWLASEEGKRVHHGSTCDGGHAYGLWQVHHYAGLPTGEEMVADRRVAIRAAMVVLRASLARTGDLCGYTGETGECRKGELRLRNALVWEKGHPYETVVAKLGD